MTLRNCGPLKIQHSFEPFRNAFFDLASNFTVVVLFIQQNKKKITNFRESGKNKHIDSIKIRSATWLMCWLYWYTSFRGISHIERKQSGNRKCESKNKINNQMLAHISSAVSGICSSLSRRAHMCVYFGIRKSDVWAETFHSVYSSHMHTQTMCTR